MLMRLQSGCKVQISTVILAGGLGTRLGRVEKALQLYQGRALLVHMLAAIKQQSQASDVIYLNVNRQFADYQAYNLPLLPDDKLGIEGPLAGVLTAVHICKSDYLWCVPCDCATLPSNTLADMLSLALHTQADIVRASFHGQAIPTLALYHIAQCCEQIKTAPPNHALYRWQNQSKVVDYVLNMPLHNLNTPTDFLG